ncbi:MULTISPECIES: hypothetical protein [Bacillus]|uniref:hypothetical protein n=1 Tax=Bacillus TaxID=1386 RepID=UPI0004589961|nr:MULTISPECIES: hypothetical protein [Bacillus]AIW37787.1 hypothetical protein KS07_09950 [Bacillus subtilis]AHZ16263.1 prophage pi3 protein 59 [Bacillus velezensis SQR9]AKF76297.1 hypothetical protein AAV30_09090 [Bacillus velezensis]AKF76348.1 hypothetical protein AAV30_09350 [Bacillus velezensis]AWD15515.1 hypothetical protein B9C53_19415 [Bacillus velezensis]
MGIFLSFIGFFLFIGFIAGLILFFIKRTRKLGKLTAPLCFVASIFFFYLGGQFSDTSSRNRDTGTELGDNTNITSLDEEKNEISSKDKEVSVSDDDSTVVHELNWSEKQNDTTFKIDRIGIVKDEMESGAEGAIAVHFVIDNGSKKDISTFPNQGTLLTNTKEQIDASLSLSEDIGGEIMSGAKKEGYVLYPIKKLQDPNEIKSVRIKWDFWPDKDVTTNVKDFDINLTW